MREYVRFITKKRVLLTIILLMILIYSLYGVTQIRLSRDFQVFVPNNSVYNNLLNEMTEDFPTKDQLILQVGYDDVVMTKERYMELIKLQQYIESSYSEIRIAGPIENTDIESITDEVIARYNERHKMLGEFSPTVIKDGRIYYHFTMFSDNKINREMLTDFESYLAETSFDYALSGDSYIQLKVFDYIRFILQRVPPVSMLIILGVFFLKLRTVKGTILSVLPAGLSAIITMGIIGHIGDEVSIITVLAPIFTLVIGSADGLHFITHVQEEQRLGRSTEDVLTKTLQMIGVPMIVTTVTSIVGFLALMVMDTSEIITFSIYASIGVLIAGLVTWYLLPVLLAGGLQLGYRGQVLAPKDMLLRKFWGKPVLIVIAAILVIFGFGVRNIKQEFNLLEIYKSYTDVYQYTMRINDVNGGSLPAFVFGDMPRDIEPDEMMSEILAFEDGLRDIEGVGKVMSAADMYDIFSEDMTIAANNLELVSEFINPGARKFRIMVLTNSYGNDILKGIRDYIENSNGRYEAYDLKLTGSNFILLELNETMLDNQIQSSVIATVVVFMLLLLSLRHVRAAFISIIPIVLTLLFLFGMMGLLGISLNIVTCTIFSITIGVGIDYAIHFTSIWRTKRLEGLSAVNSTDFAYRYASRPILANAVGLSLGFSALFISPLQFHTTVAILMWIAMMGSVVFSLVILPTMLRKI